MAANPPDPPLLNIDQSQHGGVRFGDHAEVRGPVVGRDLIVQAPKSRDEIRDAINRQRMLARVRATWIAGVLDQSLYAATRLELGLREAPEAVANPWRLVLEQPD